MVDKKQRAEPWITFIVKRFVPKYWGDLKPRVKTLMIGILLTIGILAGQLYFGVIGSEGFTAGCSLFSGRMPLC